MLRPYRILLNPTAVEGGGAETTKVVTPPPADITKAIEGLLAKHGDPNAALRAVLVERDAFRDEAKELRAKLPKEGHQVLDPDKAKLFGDYLALGPLADLTKTLDEGKAAKVQVAKDARDKHYARVAKDAGYDAEVLADRAGRDGVELVEVDGKDRAGKAVKVWSVKGKDEKDKTTPLDDYAKDKWAKYLPALKPSATNNQAKPATLGSAPRTGSAAPAPPINPERPRRSLVR